MVLVVPPITVIDIDVTTIDAALGHLETNSTGDVAITVITRTDVGTIGTLQGTRTTVVAVTTGATPRGAGGARNRPGPSVLTLGM